MAGSDAKRDSHAREYPIFCNASFQWKVWESLANQKTRHVHSMHKSLQTCTDNIHAHSNANSVLLTQKHSAAQSCTALRSASAPPPVASAAAGLRCHLLTHLVTQQMAQAALAAGCQCRAVPETSWAAEKRRAVASTGLAACAHGSTCWGAVQRKTGPRAPPGQHNICQIMQTRRLAMAAQFLS